MGQVWQAADTKLNRQVALKILPDAFADDPDRLARFQREAQILAGLNHPGIAQIYGIEESDDIKALVLELVEGPTLAEWIAQGPIPIDEALPTAKEIAEALEAAHEAGVIHRELKPANIKVREDGTVKVLDFGLAKALDAAPAGDPDQSPTLTAAATQMGVIMGTAAYMSPEQARGKPVDKRADIWAFGAVLYEMVTARPAFSGDDVTDILAAVVRAEPPWDSLPADANPRLPELLRRCLEKDPKHRWHHGVDVRIDIDRILADPEDVRVQQVAGTTPATLPARLAWTVAIAVGVAVTALAVINVIRLTALPDVPVWAGEPLRFVVSPPAGSSFYPRGSIPFAVSPDGRHIVFTARTSDRRPQLWLRALSADDARPLAGTEGGNSPFWSPEGDWIGFFTDQALNRIPVTGGDSLTITRFGAVPRMRQATWGNDDTIVFQTNSGQALSRVSVQDGSVNPATRFLEGDVNHLWPRFLEDGRRFLYPLFGALAVGSLDGEESRRAWDDGQDIATIG